MVKNIVLFVLGIFASVFLVRGVFGQYVWSFGDLLNALLGEPNMFKITFAIILSVGIIGGILWVFTKNQVFYNTAKPKRN